MAKIVYCNMCGKKMDVYDIENQFSFEGTLGYGSKFDGDTLSLDLCCDCMDKLIEKCAIPPVETLCDIECESGRC